MDFLRLSVLGFGDPGVVSTRIKASGRCVHAFGRSDVKRRSSVVANQKLPACTHTPSLLDFECRTSGKVMHAIGLSDLMRRLIVVVNEN